MRMTLEEVKKITKCSNCNKVGHWHRECPEKNVKEQHWLEMDSGEAFFCELLDVEDHEMPLENEGASNIVDFMDGVEYTIDETFGGRVPPGLPEVTKSETAAEPFWQPEF